jgi:hypothetical protein
LIEDGDVEVVPLGGEVPLVLRPRDDGGYYFVAECYVHGIMDGEALIEARKRNQEDHSNVDNSWLLRLHEADLPFSTQTFLIVWYQR